MKIIEPIKSLLGVAWSLDDEIKNLSEGKLRVRISFVEGDKEFVFNADNFHRFANYRKSRYYKGLITGRRISEEQKVYEHEDEKLDEKQEGEKGGD